MNLLEELTNQLEDAKADYEAKLAVAPDIRAAEAEIAIFRTEHALEIRRRRAELDTFLATHADLKCQRETEFAGIQRAARELADAKAEVIRATRALARQEVTSGCADRRAAKAAEIAAEEAFHARVAADHEALTQKCRREQPNAEAEHAAREAAKAERRLKG